MLKTTGFHKANLSRVHNNPFNPLTLSMGAANELTEDEQTTESVNRPDYGGLGAVYEEHRDDDTIKEQLDDPGL